MNQSKSTSRVLVSLLTISTLLLAYQQLSAGYCVLPIKENNVQDTIADFVKNEDFHMLKAFLRLTWENTGCLFKF